MTAEARICPRCSSTMVLRTAGRGRYEGQQFWGCSTYPKCRGTIALSEGQPEPEVERPSPAAGTSTQAEFEARKRRRAERIRQASGRQLVRLLRGGEARVNPEDIRALAAEADRLLRPAAKG